MLIEHSFLMSPQVIPLYEPGLLLFVIKNDPSFLGLGFLLQKGFQLQQCKSGVIPLLSVYVVTPAIESKFSLFFFWCLTTFVWRSSGGILEAESQWQTSFRPVKVAQTVSHSLLLIHQPFPPLPIVFAPSPWCWLTSALPLLQLSHPILVPGCRAASQPLGMQRQQPLLFRGTVMLVDGNGDAHASWQEWSARA